MPEWRRLGCGAHDWMSDACPTTATAAAAAAAAVSPGYGSAAAAVVSLCVSREIDISRYLRVICHPRAKRAAKFFTIFRRYLPQEALILRYDICLDRRGYVATTQLVVQQVHHRPIVSTAALDLHLSRPKCGFPAVVHDMRGLQGRQAVSFLAASYSEAQKLGRTLERGVLLGRTGGERPFTPPGGL